jgi:hypothetical protein
MQSLMSLIDKNARLIPEGDYLQMCRIMKELHRSEKTLLVTPDVVGEDFIMTSDALNRCHKWITVTNTLHDAFIEHEKDPEDKVKAGNLSNNFEKLLKSYWREFTQTYGYQELMWFIHRGTLAQRHYRHLSSLERM